MSKQASKNSYFRAQGTRRGSFSPQSEHTQKQSLSKTEDHTSYFDKIATYLDFENEILGEKFFEIPLCNLMLKPIHLVYEPIFVDIYDSILAFMIKGNEKYFYSIDVGRDKNDIKAQKSLRMHEIEKELDNIEGFKLGHFNNQEMRNVKAVIWNKKQLYVHPFNPDELIEKEDKQILNNRDFVEFDDIDEIEIYDFGIIPGKILKYNEELHEVILIKNKEDEFQIRKGHRYGLDFEEFINFDQDTQYDTDCVILEIYELKLISACKVLGLIKKSELRAQSSTDNNQSFLCAQLFEFDENKEIKMTVDIKIDQTKLIQNLNRKITNLQIKISDEDDDPDNSQLLETFKVTNRGYLHINLDFFNNQAYLYNQNIHNEHMYVFPINNTDASKIDKISISPQIAMNIIGMQYDKKKNFEKNGALFKDFIVQNQFLYLIHGKVISIFNIACQEDQIKQYHLSLDEIKEDQDSGQEIEEEYKEWDEEDIKTNINYSNFDNEPNFIWQMDKDTLILKERWKVIVAFKGGELREVFYDLVSDSFSLKTYLKPNDSYKYNQSKLEGQILQVYSNNNSSNTPVYFVFQKQDGSRVLATIEFQSQQYREFTIPDLNTNFASYIILDFNDSKKFWQEVICIESKQDDQNKILTQKLIHVKIRVAQYQLPDKSKEIVILNKEILSEKMKNVMNAKDIFVCENFVYLLHARKSDKKYPIIEKYNIKANTLSRIYLKNNVERIQIFKNQYYYWRMAFKGYTKRKYVSNICFDKLDTSGNMDSAIFEPIAYGEFPHLNKLYRDDIGNTLSCFIDISKFVIFPFLHEKNIKIKIDCEKDKKEDILHIKLIQSQEESSFWFMGKSQQNSIYVATLNSQSLIKVWDCLTGKLVKQFSDDIYPDLFKNFCWHQKLDEDTTLIRSKDPICDYQEAKGTFDTKYDSTNERNEIQMYYFKVVQFEIDKKLNDIQAKIRGQFIGPHVNQQFSGLYASKDIIEGQTFNMKNSQLIFTYLDSYQKYKLEYYNIVAKVYDDKGQSYNYTENANRVKFEDYSKQMHLYSPDFKYILQYIKNDYQVCFSDTPDTPYQTLPSFLNKTSLFPPKFIDNETLIYLSPEKILKGYDYEKKKEKFLITNCSFPGSQKIQNLNSIEIIKFKNSNSEDMHVIGENLLVYSKFSQIKSELNTSVEIELITPNYFNSLYQNSMRSCKDKDNFQEISFIQYHYKNKIELTQRGNLGYFIINTQNEFGFMQSQLNLIFSFSYYHLRLLEKIESNKISILSIPPTDLQELCYIQLEKGETLLHKIYTDKKALDHLLQVTQETSSQEKFYIPMLMNYDNKTALDKALTNYLKGNQGLIKKHTRSSSIETKNTISKLSNVMYAKVENKAQKEFYGMTFFRKQAETLIQMIEDYPFNLFNLYLYETIPKMIEEQLLQFPNFIQKQAKNPTFLQQVDRGALKIVDDDFYGAKQFEICCAWPEQIETLKQFEEKTFKIGDSAEQKKLDQQQHQELIQIELLILNIQEIHQDSDNKILTALSKCSENKFFENITIKSIIEFHWPRTKLLMKKYLFLPYTVFLVVFSIFTILDLERIDYTTSYHQQSVYEQFLFFLSIKLRLLIALFSFYFLTIEYIQYKQDEDYFHDFWNYQDIIPLLICIINEIQLWLNVDIKQIRTFYSFAAIAIWLRFLYFLRMDKKINFYIIMIQQIAVDMTQFLYIFAISIISFAHTYYILLKNNCDEGVNEDSPICTDELDSIFSAIMFSYQMAFGEFNLEKFQIYQPLFPSIFFVVSTMLVIIVLLNLLISIVGDTFASVNNDKTTVMYQDMVKLIVENQFLEVFEKNLLKQEKRGKYLIVVRPDDKLQSQEEEIKQMNFDQIQRKLTELSEQSKIAQNENQENMTRLINDQKEMQGQMNQMKDQLAQIVNYLKESSENKQNGHPNDN